jgi:hypothetical protein
MAKIGLSFSRCVRDIVEKKVDIDDVLVIISRTWFDPKNDEQWRGIWEGYSYEGRAEWGEYDYTNLEHEQMFRAITLELLKQGKLHQPRQFGGYPARRAEYWLETVLPSEELEKNPAAKKAWENFQVIAGLTGVSLDKDYQ